VTAERGVGRREQFFIKRMDLVIEKSFSHRRKAFEKICCHISGLFSGFASDQSWDCTSCSVPGFISDFQPTFILPSFHISFRIRFQVSGMF
jgi:hypothetical protein